MQETVKEFIRKYNLKTDIQSRYIDLISEVGELGKEILKGTKYGTSKISITDNLESELGDSLFCLITLANELNLDMETCLKNVLTKYEKRFNAKGNIGSN